MLDDKSIAEAFSTARKLVQSSWLCKGNNEFESFVYCFVFYDERKRDFSFLLSDEYEYKWARSEVLLGAVQFNVAQGYEVC